MITENNIIFKALVGSHSYGTNVEGSDMDYKGVFIQTPEDVLVSGYTPQYEVSKDETYYEIRRFIELCCTGNPTMLELLFTPEDCIIYKDPLFDRILEHKQKFLSKTCKLSFGGYAYSQISKAKGLDKKMNWENSKVTRKDILDFCYIITSSGTTPLKKWMETYAYLEREMHLLDQKSWAASKIPNARDMYFIFPKHKPELEYYGIVNADHSSNELRLTSIPISEMDNGFPMSFNKDGYMEHCKDYKSYTTWLAERNTQRYVDVDSHGQLIDGKNLLHCYRLIETAIEIARDKTINLRRPNAAFLIEIRKGEHNLQTLLDNAKVKIEELNAAFDASDLPDNVDMDFFLDLVIKIRQNYHLYHQNRNEFDPLPL